MLALAVTLLQAQTGPVLGPLLPAGSSVAFQEAAIATQRHLAKGDFAAAATSAKLLPTNSVRVHVDYAKLPERDRAMAKASVAAALTNLRGTFRELKFTETATTPHVTVSFSKDLGREPDTRAPRVAAILVSNDPAKPRVEAILRTTRADNSPLEANSMFNETLFALGTYLGLAEEADGRSAMVRAPGYNQVRHMFGGGPRSVALRNQVIAQQLRGYIAKKQVVIPAIAELAVEPRVQNLGNQVQGTLVPGSFAITNNGNVDLQVTIVPDCGCFRFQYANTIKPGMTEIAKFTADTTSFFGRFRKKLTLVTNDPERAAIVIPVEMEIEPVYRFLRSNPVPVEMVPDTGLARSVILAFGKDSEFRVKSVEVNGATAQASFEPWRGKMADPEMGVGEVERRGYEISVLISPNIPTGRAPLSLIVETDHPVFSSLVYTFQVQRGIVPLPQSVYFGEIAGAKTIPFTVSRPGKPFRILRVTADDKRLTFTPVASTPNTEFRISATITPGTVTGTIAGTITVETDDPKQPKLYLPFQAFRK